MLVTSVTKWDAAYCLKWGVELVSDLFLLLLMRTYLEPELLIIIDATWIRECVWIYVWVLHNEYTSPGQWNILYTRCEPVFLLGEEGESLSSLVCILLLFWWLNTWYCVESASCIIPQAVGTKETPMAQSSFLVLLIAITTLRFYRALSLRISKCLIMELQEFFLSIGQVVDRFHCKAVF